MATERITEAELLEALAQSVPGDALENARTSEELRQEFHIGEYRMGKMLKLLAKQNRLVTHRVLRRSVDDRWVPVQAYTVLR